MEYIGCVIGISFVLGVVTGLILAFTAIKVSMLLPMLNKAGFEAPPRKASKPTVPQRRWDPRSLMPPGDMPGMGGPGPNYKDTPLEYDSPLDFISDPVDPKKERGKE